MNKYFSEFSGTFILVFIGTSAIVVNDVSGGVVTHVGISIAFGLVVTSLINVATGAKETGIMAGVAIGGVVGMEALLTGPISMNPARSLGLALVSGHLEHFWLYVVVPVIGAGLAIFSCQCVRTECCQ